MIKTFGKTYTRSLNSLFVGHAGLNRFFQVGEAIVLANELLQNPEFYCRIAAHPGFEMADVSPEIIAGMMCETRVKMSVNLYYATDSCLNIDGYDDVQNPSSVHLNIWKIDRSAASLCNSIIHGCVHAVNDCNKFYSFGHGNSSSAAIENTAPYWIGALAQRMASKEDPIVLPLQHDPDAPGNAKMTIDIEAINNFSQSIWLSC